MKMLQEFKQFALRGNVMDMAIGISIGAAFGKIISSAVADVIMPPNGLLIGGVDFSDLAFSFKVATQDIQLQGVVVHVHGDGHCQEISRVIIGLK